MGRTTRKKRANSVRKVGRPHANAKAAKKEHRKLSVSHSKNNIIVIEIPHQMPPIVYWTTKEKIIEVAFWDEKYADDVVDEQEEMENKPLEEQFEFAFDVVTHDNYLSQWFESKKEALNFAKKLIKDDLFKYSRVLDQLNNL